MQEGVQVLGITWAAARLAEDAKALRLEFQYAVEKFADYYRDELVGPRHLTTIYVNDDLE